MKTGNSIAAVVMTIIFIISLTGCEKNMSRTDYASSVLNIYSEYTKKFDEIYDAVQGGQTVTAGKLCDEASDILKKMTDLNPPQVFKDEHKKVVKCCDDENEKLSLQKELIELSKNASSLTQEQQERANEITNRMQELSAKSGDFEQIVEVIAGKQLETQATTDKNMLNQPGVEMDTY